ncbi:uncharacterized protein LOC126842128 [Adelges cooleyi]|uniref:uncharacterized protein LOC126842128 n=1 Tax=Adelges cooleyi TaxID=133065 RepID=UPI00217F2F76|nr:uncharacterized protein LOC126842128 [Adelges cooleyi]
MLFKISILLLSINLTVNTVSGQTEDEILRDLYENCRMWSNTPPGENISQLHFLYYIGKSTRDFARLITYIPTDGNRAFPDLDLEQFTILFKQICSERGVFVKDWAASRKFLASSRTIQEVAHSQPEHTDNEDEEKALKDSFDDCRKWLSRGSSEPLDTNIDLSGFCWYMGINDNTVLNDYFKNNQHARERMEYNYRNNLNLNQGPIDFTLYCGVFRHICSINGDSLEDLIARRKNEAAARTVHEYIMSLSPEERD